MSLHYLRLEAGQSLKPYEGAAPIRVVVVVEEPVSVLWRGAVSTWLVEAGCRYMMAWGLECSLWDDSVDWAVLEKFKFEEIPEEHFVMTTWHEQDTLDDVFWYAKNNAFVEDHPIEDAHTLILHIGREDRGREFMERFIAA